MSGIRYGSESADAYSFTRDVEELAEIVVDANGNIGIYTIFDSSASDIYISALWYDDFVRRLMSYAGKSQNQYEIKDGVLYADCDGGEDDDSYPDLYFLVGGYDLMVSREDYLTETGAGKCSLAFKNLAAPFNILGSIVYLDYYVAHELDTGNMIWSRHGASSDMPQPEEVEFPMNQFRVKFSLKNDPTG